MGILKFYILVALGVLGASCSQILLKKSAVKFHHSMLAEMLNWQVLVAYSVFFASVIINVIALRYGVKVKDLPILEALGYIFVPLLSYFFLGEKLNKKNVFAMILIIGGIVLFYL